MREDGLASLLHVPQFRDLRFSGCSCAHSGRSSGTGSRRRNAGTWSRWVGRQPQPRQACSQPVGAQWRWRGRM